MKQSLWVIFVIVAVFLGFLIGYSVSSYTGIQKVGYVGSAESGGYAGEAGGYGGEAGGYGGEAGGYGQEAVKSEKESAEYGERLEYFGE